MDYKKELSFLYDNLDDIVFRFKHFICRSLEDWNSQQTLKYSIYVNDIPPKGYQDLYKSIRKETREDFADLCFISKTTFDNMLKDPLYAIKNSINIAKICRLNNYDFVSELNFILHGGKPPTEKEESFPLINRLFKEIEEKYDEFTRIHFMNLIRLSLKNNSFPEILSMLEKISLNGNIFNKNLLDEINTIFSKTNKK